MEPFTIYFFIGFFAVIITINIVYFIWQDQQEKKRSEIIKAMSFRIGMHFSAKDAYNIFRILKDFQLFKRGTGKLVKNILLRQERNCKLYIFDYKYSASSGKSQHDYWQTVAFFQTENIRFTQFLLKPKGMWDKLGHFFGYQDIKFENYPRFSEKYLLKGSNEQAIRQVFTDNVLRFCEAKIGVYPPTQATPCVEAADSRLIFYREHTRLQPEELESFRQEALEVFDLFRLIS